MSYQVMLHVLPHFDAAVFRSGMCGVDASLHRLWRRCSLFCEAEVVFCPEETLHHVPSSTGAEL